MIKKTMIMSVGLGAAALALNATDASAAGVGTVKADVLNLRSGAGTQNAIIGKLYNGNSIEILSTSNGWHNVKTMNGKTGWVSAQYVSTSTETVKDKGVVVASALNIRSGAGTNHSIISKLYKGSTVEILSTSNGWHKIKLSNGKTGWVSAQYIGDSSNNNNNNNESTVIGKGKVTASTLNVRSGAGTGHSVISKLYKGNTVEILSTSNGWHKIKLSNGKIGWVSAQYIGDSSNSGNGESSNNNESTVTGKGEVTASALNLRSGAGTSHSVVGTLYRGTEVDVLSESNGWNQVKSSNGKVGWVSSKYIGEPGTSGNSNGGSESNEDENSKPSSGSVQDILNLANAQVGKPYVWGAEGPNSFDCSGLVYYIYKNAAGVNLPRTSSAQSTVGTTISKSQLQPGDLIFAATGGGSSVSHVGIYIGNGQMIHAPKPGDVVKVTSMNNSYWDSVFVTAKRVL